MTPDIPTIAAGLSEAARKLPAGTKRAILAMSGDWQFCGRATFNANGAWSAFHKLKAYGAVQMALQNDGKWTRRAFRLNETGLAVRAYLQGKTS